VWSVAKTNDADHGDEHETGDDRHMLEERIAVGSCARFRFGINLALRCLLVTPGQEAEDVRHAVRLAPRSGEMRAIQQIYQQWSASGRGGPQGCGRSESRRGSDAPPATLGEMDNSSSRNSRLLRLGGVRFRGLPDHRKRPLPSGSDLGSLATGRAKKENPTRDATNLAFGLPQLEHDPEKGVPVFGKDHAPPIS